MPKALVATAPGKLAWQTYQDARLDGRQIRVKAEFGAAKHGTEMSVFKGYGTARGRWNEAWQFFEAAPQECSYPFQLGNMFVGTVLEVGPQVTSFKSGDRVLGWGGFRQTHTLSEAALQRLPKEVPWQAAVCNDPAHFALGAIRDGQVRLGDCVAIFGMGAIGLVAVQMARLAGAQRVVAADPLPHRRAVAKALGADLVLDPTACDAGREVKSATDKRGADVIVDFSGHRLALQAALRGIAFGGKIVCGAYPPPYDGGVDFGGEAHMNIPEIIFSRACSSPDRDHPRWTWQRVQDACRYMLEHGCLRCEEIVGPVVKFDDLLTEYPRVAADPSAGVKLGVRY